RCWPYAAPARYLPCYRCKLWIPYEESCHQFFALPLFTKKLVSERSIGVGKRRHVVPEVHPDHVDVRPVPPFLVVYVSRDVALEWQERHVREPSRHDHFRRISAADPEAFAG
ncbi:unnamed protein product, partial [Ectocarpus sp. 12 AP-2014]